MNLVEKIQNLAQEYNYSISSLEKALGFGNGTIKKWDNSSPSVDKIITLANFLNISIDWLLTGKESNIVTIEVEKRMEQFTDDLGRMTDPEVDIIHKFRKLDERDQEDTIAYVNMKYKRTVDIQKRTSLKFQSGEETTATLENNNAKLA